METVLNKQEQSDEVRRLLLEHNPFHHPDLALVSLGGSKNTDSFGPRSDIDITTVMKPETQKKVDVNSIITLADQIRKFSFTFVTHSNLLPIIVATIRLEEAQIALAEAVNPDKIIVPIHWLHYPSVEFATMNEPPDLFLGLIKGNVIFGEQEKITQSFQEANHSAFPHLAGLDWLTDSLRIFLANRNEGEFPVSPQPDSFLKRLASHNLEYFWRWKIIRQLAEKTLGISPNNWKEVEQVADALPRDVWRTACWVRKLRHQGGWAPTPEIVTLHKETFNIWPI